MEPRCAAPSQHTCATLGVAALWRVPDVSYFLSGREDIKDLSQLLSLERKLRRDEVAIDLEERQTKKGTPPRPTEEGDIRELRRMGASNPTNTTVQRPAPMVE